MLDAPERTRLAWPLRLALVPLSFADELQEFASLVAAGLTWLLTSSVANRVARRLLLPASPRFVAAMTSAAERTGIALPRLHEFELPFANALAAVDAHTVVATRRGVVLLGIAAVPWIAQAFAPSSIALLLLSAFVVATLAQRIAASVDEQHADALAQATEREPGTLLRALRKLHLDGELPLALGPVRARRRGLLARMFGPGGAHGSFAERAAALGTVPTTAESTASMHASSPQPSAAITPPPRGRAQVALIAGALLIATPMAIVLVAALVSSVFAPTREGRARDVALVLGQQPVVELRRRAEEAAAAGREDEAGRLTGIAMALPPDESRFLRSLADRLFFVGTLESIEDQRDPPQPADEPPGR